jgi:hypothetical protein
VRCIFRIWAVLVVVAWAVPARSVEPKLEIELEYKFPELYLESPRENPVTLWDRFEFAFERGADKVFTDRFHPLITSQWQVQLTALDAFEFRDHTTRLASRALSRSITTSAREAVFDLPFVQWLDGRRSFFVDLLLYSVDTVEEESVAPLDPSYRAMERSWWKRLADSKNFCFGVRPFRTSPYAFMSTSIWNGETLLMLAHVRYHYEDFSNHKFELALSLPLPHGFSIDAGTAYQITRHEDVTRMVFKLNKQFKNGGVMHIGMEAQEHPNFLVGMSLPL